VERPTLSGQARPAGLRRWTAGTPASVDAWPATSPSRA
jgi:hypothetical protein